MYNFRRIFVVLYAYEDISFTTNRFLEASPPWFIHRSRVTCFKGYVENSAVTLSKQSPPNVALRPSLNGSINPMITS